MKLTREIPKKIFREYDIRGVYPIDINEDVSYTIGRGFGSYLKLHGKVDCIVGQDNRYSSPIIANAFISGVVESGIHVLDLGLVTTPMYYYACLKTETESGCMITASHNPKDDNGFKIAFENDSNAKGKEITDFYDFLMKGEFTSGDAIHSRMDMKESYINYLLSSVNIKKPLRVVVDCGNGTTSILAMDVFNRVSNISPIILYGKSDPEFSNHHPDPSVDENLRVLQNTVLELKADIGLAFDGDGDRVGVVDDKGRIVRIDNLMALFVRKLASPGTKFLYDVKCGKTLIDEINKANAEGIMTRTGNSYTKAYTKEYDCIMGGEYSGHIYFRDKFLGFDSGIYAGLRTLELLSESDNKLSDLVDSLNQYVSTPELKFKSSDENKFKVVAKIKTYAKKKGYNFTEIDGIRVTFDDSWVSVRASNTGPNITMRVEASTKERLENILQEFENKLTEILNKTK